MHRINKKLTTLIVLVILIIGTCLFLKWQPKEGLNFEITEAEYEEYYKPLRDNSISLDTSYAELRKAANNYFKEHYPNIPIDSKEFEEMIINNYLGDVNGFDKKLWQDSDFTKTGLYILIYSESNNLINPLSERNNITLVEKNTDTLDMIIRREILDLRRH